MKSANLRTSLGKLSFEQKRSFNETKQQLKPIEIVAKKKKDLQ